VLAKAREGRLNHRVQHEDAATAGIKACSQKSYTFSKIEAQLGEYSKRGSGRQVGTCFGSSS
jgi:hypothetical protein